ncbi:hypothetical protein Tco_0893530 [Tanacetum coccineum]|uniref:Reverse transcriptase domain-containing protein n=1 Tax=Tanacetum coccineum TaxID=301880 RepID=A0ABQ5CC69_9ASTR
MSDSDESGITYTAVSSPYEDLSDIGSPRADDHEFLELPYMPEDPYVEAALQAPPSPDYVPGPEEPEQAPLSPDYVPGPEHADDEIVAEDQPGAEDASPTAQCGDDEIDIEDDDMDIKADKVDEDDEMDAEVDKEEHPAPAYHVVVALPATAPSAEETEPFETDESAATHHSPCYDQMHHPSATSTTYFVPPLLLPSVSHREDRPEVNLHLGEVRKSLWSQRYEVGESSAAAATRQTGEVMSLRTTVHVHMTEITELQSADRSRRRAISDLLETNHGRRDEMRELRAADRTRQQQIIQTLMGQVTALQGQQGPAGGPAQPELPEEAGTDVVKYNQRFQELALLCVRMFPEESDKIERYVGGLPDMIHGNIIASKPKTMQEAIEMATELMDKRVSTIAERQAENKRKAFTAGQGTLQEGMSKDEDHKGNRGTSKLGMKGSNEWCMWLEMLWGAISDNGVAGYVLLKHTAML